MSLCSAEEIAEKRRIALERLNVRKQETTTRTASSPVIAKNPPATGNNAASFLGAFRNNNNPDRHLNQARISAQPYPKQAPLKTQPSSAFQQNKAPELAPIFVPNNIRVVHCRCAMVTASRFGVYMSEYHGKAIDVCKTIPSRSYGGSPREVNLLVLNKKSASSFQMATEDCGPSISSSMSLSWKGSKD